MRLLVLSNTDQYGSSGVGDFALMLNQELKRRGVDTTIAAINPNPSLRHKQLSELIRNTRPDWVSLHFVPYAYATRGLVGRNSLPWSKIRGRLGTHILFHEIWVGVHKGALWRHRAIGNLQHRGIQQMLEVFKPDVVHCTNSLYSSILKRAGINNHVLPLFGSIPVNESCQDPYLNLLPSLVSGMERSKWVVACLFGSIHPSFNFLRVVQWLNARCSRHSKRLLLVSLGHAPTAQAQFESISTHFSHETGPFFYVSGKLDARDLSCWIRGADCGLATTPFNIIDKSSSAVAFVEHGIPVIVMDPGSPVEGISYRQQDLAPEFWLFGDNRLETYDILPPCRDPESRINRVANQFLADLNIYG